MVGNWLANEQGRKCRPYFRKINFPIDLRKASGVFSRQIACSILGGNQAEAVGNRYSYFACQPREVFEFASNQTEPFKKLSAVFSRYRHDSSAENNGLPDGVFIGGWIGYFAYDLDSFIENIPETAAADDIGMPLVRLCFYDRFLCVDNHTGDSWAAGLEIEDDKEKIEDKLGFVERLAEQSTKENIIELRKGSIEDVDFENICCNISKGDYIEALGKIRRYIYDGDVYQINFSQRFSCPFGAEPIELFCWQNAFNPSPYSAFIDGGDFAIVSASPELFIDYRVGVLKTKPIKGTRKRLSSDSGEDFESINSRNYADLLNCEKEKAELNMIIDLERNDLGRFCEYGSIKVIQSRTIEAYPTVFHCVATVQGAVRDEISFCDCIKAMFPGGSITGAPKIRAMEIIDALEPSRRGVYTGSIGYIGVDGNVCLNIAIRTVIIKAGGAFVQTGGGIVADSDPYKEWDETLVKARALIAGIKAL